jgi:hypothetical protein
MIMLNSLVVMKSTSTSKNLKADPHYPEVRTALRYTYLLLASILLLPIIFIGLEDFSARTWDWYAAAVQGGYVAVYALIAPTLVLLAKGKQLSKWLRVVCNILVVATILVLAWLAIGLLQDLIGIQCQGFFGAPTSCADGQYLSLLIWVINPYVLLSLIGVTILALGKGWFDYFYYEDRV